MAQIVDTPKMSNMDIIKAHSAKNTPDVTADTASADLAKAVQLGFKLIRFYDVLIAFKPNKDTALMYIMNGGDSRQYLRALKQFVQAMKEAKFKSLTMYISDKESASKIASTAGVQKVSFKEDKKKEIDPYLMTMEL